MRDHNTALREFLRDRDAQCPACGYSLRDCVSAQCPECGAALELALVPRHGNGVAWWAAGMAGAAIAAGLASVVLLVTVQNLAAVAQDPSRLQLISQGFSSQREAPAWRSIFAAIALAALSLAIWLLAVRRRFSAWTTKQQVASGIAGAASPFALLAVLYLLVRFVL